MITHTMPVSFGKRLANTSLNARQLAELVVVLALTLMLFAWGMASAQAQESAAQTEPAYYLSPDAEGIYQIYQTIVGDDSSPDRQITYATADVLNFGVAYDGLSVAYYSANKLWLQPVHTEAPEALADISTAQFFSGPVYSPDGSYLAYADSGVWLMNLATRETRQILADVNMEPGGPTEFRYYNPEQFVMDADGRPSHLIVDVGVWEWNSAGVYDLATDSFLFMEGQIHNNILPLSSGFVFIYGNGGVAGDPSIRIAPTLADINNAVTVVNFADMTDQMLFAEQAVEIAPDVVRVIGQVVPAEADELRIFYFDYNLVSGAGPVQFITLPQEAQTYATIGRISPDGSLLPIYFNSTYREYGVAYGKPGLLDLASGKLLERPLPEMFGAFTWQP